MEKAIKQAEEFIRQVANPNNLPKWFSDLGTTGSGVLELISDGLYYTTENPYFLIQNIDNPIHRSAILKSATRRQRQQYFLESRNRIYTALVVALEYLFDIGTPAAADLAKIMNERLRIPGFNGYFFQPIAGFNLISIDAPDGDWPGLPVDLYQIVAREYKNLAERLRQSLRRDGIRNQACAYILAVRALLSNLVKCLLKKKSVGISTGNHTATIMHYFIKSPWPPVLIRQADKEDKITMHPVFFPTVEIIVNNPPRHGSGDLSSVFGGHDFLNYLLWKDLACS